jgi:hypothetical protein
MPLFSGEHYLLAASTDARPSHRLLDESRLATYAVLVRSAASDVPERVLSCTDVSQLDIWADRPVTAAWPEEVFGS